MTPALSLAQVKLQNMALSVGLKEDLRASMLVHHGALEPSPDLQSFAWASNCPRGTSTDASIPKLRPLTVSTEGRVSQTEDGLWALVGDVETADMDFDLALTYKDERDWQARSKHPASPFAASNNSLTPILGKVKSPWTTAFAWTSTSALPARKSPGPPRPMPSNWRPR